MNGARPLLVTQDADLIDDVLRLAAAGGVEVHLAADGEAARGRWALAPLVLVGADEARRVAAARLPRRRDVVLVSRDAQADDWEAAVGMGAEHVARLPEAERWLIDRITDCGEGSPRHGRVIAVMGCGGGAGASTLAASLGLAAAGVGARVLLVDGDPLAGGIDLLLGAEESAGARWDALVETRGRLGIATLQQNLPSVRGMSVLSWGRHGPTEVPVEAWAAVLDAGQRGADLVVVDLPARLDAAAELVLARASDTVLVAATHVRSAAAASRLVAAVGSRCVSIRVVLRVDARGIDDEAVAGALDVEVAGLLPYVSAVASRADHGDPPLARDAYARAVSALLPALGIEHARSA